MRLGGVIPILPTPFDQDESVDCKQIPALVDFCVSVGAGAIGVPAFGSEFYKLDGLERERIIATAIEAAAGRLPVIVQCNHTHPKVAAMLARRAAEAGASAVNSAIPRTFPSSQQAVRDFGRRVCDSTDLPVVLQDWNPGGPTLSAEDVAAIHEACPNFQYVKYEEPGIGDRLREIRHRTGGGVTTFSGWGGMFMLELIPPGIAGIMPGLAIADYLALVWTKAAAGAMPEAYGLFAKVLPYLHFSLQNLEQFHHVEKRMLVRRGVLKSAVVREVTVSLSADAEHYLEMILSETIRALEEAGFASAG